MSNVIPIRKLVEEPAKVEKEITYTAREVAAYALAALGMGFLAGFFVGTVLSMIALKVG
jgi:hypothetical protein